MHERSKDRKTVATVYSNEEGEGGRDSERETGRDGSRVVPVGEGKN